MVRNVIGFITGLVVGFIVVAGIQMINYGMFPLPDGLETSDKEGMLKHIQTLPPLAYIIVYVAHILGSLLAAVVAVKIADNSKFRISMALGLFFTVVGLVNIATIPHPLWFSILDTFGYLPAAYLGYRIAN